MNHVYSSRVTNRQWPWELPKQKRHTEGTIFHQKFLSITIDEIHEMRTLGTRHYAALRIMQQGTLKLGLTGTPLQTSPKVSTIYNMDFSLFNIPQDIASIGRLIGVPHFLTETACDEEKEDSALFRRAKKMDDDGRSLLSAQVDSVRRMQKQFLGSILRRTTDSINWCGQTLLNLPPHEDIVGILNLTKRETDIINERAEAAKAR